MTELLAIIAKVQEIYHLSDRKLAQKLAVSPSLLCRVKSGKRVPSAKFLGALTKQFPETALHVMDYLKGEGDAKAS